MRTWFVWLGSLCLLWSLHAQESQALTGRVLDEKGRPVVGAKVYYGVNTSLWYFNVEDASYQTTTDSQGRYRFELKTKPSFQNRPALFAYHPQHGIAADPSRGAIPDFSKPIDLRLQPLATFKGKVVNEQGQPLPNVRVRPLWVTVERGFSISFPPVEPFLVRTDANGSFTLPLVKGASALMLQASAPGYAFHEFWFTKPKGELVLKIEPGAVLTGRLVHERTGQPMANLPVLITTSRQPRSYMPHLVFTDAQGRFRSEVPRGQCAVVPGNDYRAEKSVPAGTFKPVEIEVSQAGEEYDAGDFQVRTEPLITFEARTGNKPLPGCTITFQPPDRPDNVYYGFNAITDSQGRAQIALPDGSYQIQAYQSTPDGRYYSLRLGTTIMIEKGKPQSPEPIVLTMDESIVSTPKPIAIRVRTSRNQPPKAIWSNLGTEWGGPEEPTSHRLEGDRLLTEAFVMPNNKMELIVLLDPKSREGAVLKEVNIQRLPSLVRLRPLPLAQGRVLDSRGNPVRNAQVRLRIILQQQFEEGRAFPIWRDTNVIVNTDSQGRFKLPYLSGVTSAAIITAKGYTPQSLWLQKGKPLKVQLKPATATYAGIVLGADGKPASNADIHVSYLPTTLGKTHSPITLGGVQFPITLGRFQTDKNGRFELKNMPLEISLFVQPEGGGEAANVDLLQPTREIVIQLRSWGFPGEAQKPLTPQITKEFVKEFNWLAQEPEPDKPTLILFTTTYLPQNSEWLRQLETLKSEELQIVYLFDTTDRKEVEAYCQQVNLSGIIGYLKTLTPLVPVNALSLNLPHLPYALLLDAKGKMVKAGIACQELPKTVQTAIKQN